MTGSGEHGDVDLDPGDAAEVGTAEVGTAEVVVPCAELEPSLDFYQRLGLALELITPADGPTTAVVAGFGVRLRLQADPSVTPAGHPPIRLRLTVESRRATELGERLIAPEGTVVEVVAARETPELPEAAPSFELSTFDRDAFASGRAAMAYRDLLPGRQGGRYVASHIRIADGGPVPDYVHYHRILFQMIYCRRGWVRVVYEDQGDPFVLAPGDCVLQPPGIRHRVLEASDGLEVVEVGCPAVHDTRTDPALDLPNGRLDTDRRFGGQRFVRHVAAEATPTVDADGFIGRDLGLATATDGLASVRVVRTSAEPTSTLAAPDDCDLYFLFVDHGTATIARSTGAEIPLGPGDAVSLPAAEGDTVSRCSDDFEAIELVIRHPASG